MFIALKGRVRKVVLWPVVLFLNQQRREQMTTPSPATLHLYTDPEFRAPSRHDVRAVIQILDMTGDQVAGLVGVTDGRAVRRWLAPETSKTHAQIDYATWRLLLLEAGLVRLQNRISKNSKSLRKAKLSRSKRPNIDTEARREDPNVIVPG